MWNDLYKKLWTLLQTLFQFRRDHALRTFLPIVVPGGCVGHQRFGETRMAGMPRQARWGAKRLSARCGARAPERHEEASKSDEVGTFYIMSLVYLAI